MINLLFNYNFYNAIKKGDEMIKVMIIDEHKSVLDAFSTVIDKQEDMQFVAGAASSRLVEVLFRKELPDILLTAVFIEKANSGIELTKKVKANFPQIKIITMSGFNDLSYIPEAKNAGADGYVLKSRPLAELLTTIRAVMDGKKIFPRHVQLSTKFGKTKFSSRELEVLNLLCKSYKKKEVAEALQISPGTVKRHVENMLNKSGYRTSMELVINALKNGHKR